MRRAHLFLGFVIGLTFVFTQNLQAQSSQFIQNYYKQTIQKVTAVRPDAEIMLKPTYSPPFLCATYLTAKSGWAGAKIKNLANPFDLSGIVIETPITEIASSFLNFFGMSSPSKKKEGEGFKREEGRNYKDNNNDTQKLRGALLIAHSRAINMKQEVDKYSSRTQDPEKLSVLNYVSQVADTVIKVTGERESGQESVGIEWIDEIVMDGSDGKKNMAYGDYDSQNNRIRLSEQAADPAQTLIHEITHFHNHNLAPDANKMPPFNDNSGMYNGAEHAALGRLSDEFLADFVGKFSVGVDSDLQNHYFQNDNNNAGIDMNVILRDYLLRKNSLYQFDKYMFLGAWGFSGATVLDLFDDCEGEACIDSMVTWAGDVNENPYVKHKGAKAPGTGNVAVAARDKSENPELPHFSIGDPEKGQAQDPSGKPTMKDPREKAPVKVLPDKTGMRGKKPTLDSHRPSKDEERRRKPSLSEANQERAAGKGGKESGHRGRPERHSGPRGAAGNDDSVGGSPSLGHGNSGNERDRNTGRGGNKAPGTKREKQERNSPQSNMPGRGAHSTPAGNSPGSPAAGNAPAPPPGAGQGNAGNGAIPAAPTPPAEPSQNSSNITIWYSTNDPVNNADGSITTFYGYFQEPDGTTREANMRCSANQCQVSDGSTFTPMNGDGSPMTADQCTGNCGPQDGTAIVNVGSNGTSTGTDNSGSGACADGSNNCNNSGGRVNPDANSIPHLGGQGIAPSPHCQVDGCPADPRTPWTVGSLYGPHPSGCYADGCVRGEDRHQGQRVPFVPNPNECHDDGCGGGKNPEYSPIPMSGPRPRSNPNIPRAKASREKEDNNRNERGNEQERERVRENKR